MLQFIKRFFVLFNIFFIGFASNGLAQNNTIDKISIVSPTAASLGKYGDIPVSYHTGIPQINIPIYTVTAGSLKLPISLSYHASGLKVQEPAGWVGAGWALNAGGVISRSVMGGPDEKAGYNSNGVELKGHYSDYGYNNYLYQNAAAGHMQDWLSFYSGVKDGEPDLYFFNFGNYSGKFYFRDDRTPVIIPEQDFKIVPAYDPSTDNSIHGFVITTPDGVQYSFGAAPGINIAPVEMTTPVSLNAGISGITTPNIVSSWFLNKINTIDNQFVITLTYQTESYGYHTFSMFSVEANPIVNLSIPIIPLFGDPSLMNAVPALLTPSTFGSIHGYNLVKNIVQGVRLSQISFPNGSINFIPTAAARTDLSDNMLNVLTDNVNTNAKALGAIQVTDINNKLLRSYNLSYSYFTDNQTLLAPDVQNFAAGLQTDRQRLRLDQVQEVSADNSIKIPPHLFTYFTEQVPRRLSFGIDHWGFYNGVTNSGLIPAYTRFGSNTADNFPGANREASWPAMRGGTLQQITYPTGGFSLFEFESNTVYNTTTAVVNTTLANLFINNNYGQAPTIVSGNFINSGNFVSDGSAISLQLNNGSSYGATLTITNSNKTVVYTTPLRNNQQLPAYTYTLPVGSYVVTLSIDSKSTGAVTASLTQLQTVLSTNTIAVGGNRIKSITHNDGITNNNQVINYSYLQDNNQSSGILYSKPYYVGIIRNDVLKNVGYYTVSPSRSGFQALIGNGVNGCPTVTDAAYFKSSSSIRPMGTSQGYHIGYGQVKVSQTGNGYSLYKYYGATGVPSWQANNGDVSIHIVNTQGCDANAPNYPAAPLPFDFMRGELQYEASFTQAGQMVKETSYTPVYVNSLITTPGFIVAGLSGPRFMATYYQLTTAHKTKTQIIETVYGALGATPLVNNSTSYNESPNHHEVTRISTNNSKGELMETKKTYAFDYRLTTCDGIADGFTKYNTDCNSCLVSYNNARITKNCGDSASCLTTAYLNYLECQIIARTNYTTYQQTNFTNPVNTFKTYHDQALAAADALLKPILDLQNSYQNPAIEISKWKNHNLTGALFSKYDYSVLPAGQVYLSKVQAINLTIASPGFTASSTLANNSVVQDNRYIDETVVKFYKGNLADFTARNGITTAYIWDSNNLLPIVKATGVSQAILLAAFTAVGGDLSKLRNYPSLSGALINTYSYTTIIGMASETDANNNTTTYTYDALQRLLLVRDFNNNILKQYDYKYQVK